jgi:hypothetical protein
MGVAATHPADIPGATPRRPATSCPDTKTSLEEMYGDPVDLKQPYVARRLFIPIIMALRATRKHENKLQNTYTKHDLFSAQSNVQTAKIR